MNDINAHFNRESDGSVAEKDGIEAFFQGFQNTLLTQFGEMPDDEELGTVIDSYRYSINVFNALMLERLIFNTVNDNFEEIKIKENEISVTPDYENEEYVVKMKVRKVDQTELYKDLTINVEKKR